MIKKPTILLITPLLAIFIANRLFFSTPNILERVSSYITYPVLQISSTITNPIKNFFEKRLSHNELHARYDVLEKNNEELLAENIKLKATLHYAKKSAEIREFVSRYNLENTILAKILIKNISPNEHTIVINRGTRDGVEKNMVAIYKFQLVGRVKEVLPTYSKITLITDRRSKISSHTNTSNVKGIVQGTNQINRCKLSYISHLKPLQNGDFVLSSGQGLIFPEGLCLGKIVDIQTDGLCHNVELEPLVDLSSIEMCHVTNQSKMNLF